MRDKYVILKNDELLMSDRGIRTYMTKERATKHAKEHASLWYNKDATFEVGKLSVVEREKLNG